MSIISSLSAEVFAEVMNKGGTGDPQAVCPPEPLGTGPAVGTQRPGTGRLLPARFGQSRLLQVPWHAQHAAACRASCFQHCRRHWSALVKAMGYGKLRFTHVKEEIQIS